VVLLHQRQKQKKRKCSTLYHRVTSGHIPTCLENVEAIQENSDVDLIVTLKNLVWGSGSNVKASAY
jgi:hypothetical protein